MPTLIGIHGKAGCGKDTLADYLVRAHKARKYNFALPIKQAINAMIGSTMDQWDDRDWKENPIPWLGKSPRQLAQTLGTEWGRDLIHPELWIRLAEQRYAQYIDDYAQDFSAIPPFVIPDVRFDNECRMIHTHGGIVVAVDRPEVKEINRHVSEAGIDPALIDMTIVNDGTVEEFVTRGACYILNFSSPLGAIRRGD